MKARDAALMAARSVREMFPDDYSTGVVLQAVGDRCILTAAFNSPDGALALAEVVGVAATELILAADSYHQEIYPDRQPIPPHGDLQERFYLGDPDVTECMLVYTATRTDSAMALLPYHREGGRIVWADWQPDPDSAVEAGNVPEVLQAALTDDPVPVPNMDTVLRWLAAALASQGIEADITDHEPDPEL